MARKISELACRAFYNREKFKLSNTEVTVSDNVVKLRLWGNTIAKISENEIWFTLAGWDTVTTFDRLRAVGVPLRKRNGYIYVGDKDRKINSYDWYKLKDYGE